ncbi:SDR family oxidoreductase [Agromyces aerolatus]|uniref:SDR family oxidoreductase n=1 Tax=Agromyces sp. LY-1074 TaxID=3074080 RepID=UPI00285FC89E|nr:MULTISPECIES: SDR family oxidoreductase [unclassified Agromyces]MDR5699689.1 SDR family oxidoreductase [Agromyces sp. LY-1074]MDR5705985.1 SDR family oxidoreductase [Agromyces sp. LY-1358]
MADILIIGGHGKVALRLERLLAERGDRVDAVIRNPEHASDVEAAGAKPVVADIELLDVDGLAELLSGHDAVVWSAGAGGGNPARTVAVDRDAAIRSMAAAERAGVRRYVMVSYFGSPDRSVPEDNAFHTYAEAKADADEHLATTGLDWTILGPGQLTDEPGSGAIDVAADESGPVSRQDVAAVAAAALADDRSIRRTIRFTSGGTPIAEAVAAG